MGPFLSGHNPRLVREGRVGPGKSASQERGPQVQPEEAGREMLLRAGVGPRTPCPKLFWPITTPAGQGGAGPQ